MKGTFAIWAAGLRCPANWPGAKRLARQASASLPAATGFFGMDLVLGPEGPESDVVIEVNPRLTTSYLGLRLLARQNLAAVMLAVAEGRDAELSFGSQRVEFAPDAASRTGGKGGWGGVLEDP